jgi:hypothetical protein
MHVEVGLPVTPHPPQLQLNPDLEQDLDVEQVAVAPA